MFCHHVEDNFFFAAVAADGEKLEEIFQTVFGFDEKFLRFRSLEIYFFTAILIKNIEKKCLSIPKGSNFCMEVLNSWYF